MSADVEKMETSAPSVDSNALKPQEMQDILHEIMEQPAWRTDADRAFEYYDGNQIDSETLNALADIGMAPQIENLIQPTIDAITGLEAKTRKDWKVTAQSMGNFEEVAEALGQKLFEAEQQTFADKANSEAFKAAVVSGIGWIKVGRNSNPFQYPYTYKYVHRDEIYWDMKANEPDGSDMTWLMRSRWYDAAQLKQAFPEHATLLTLICTGWDNIDIYLDGDKAQSALQRSAEIQRDYPVEGYEYVYNQRRLRLNEVWVRRWVTGTVIKLPNGIVEEYDSESFMHIQAAQNGAVVKQARYTKVYQSFWIGMHKLLERPNPHKHGEIPYVPVIGYLEDKTRIPYGKVRSMIPMQDEINARNTKLIWLLAGKRVTMTDGATVDDPEIVRQEAGRPDAMHILDREAMRDGGIFKVESDFGLSQQQYQALIDKRQAIKSAPGVYSAFEGANTQQSGVALHAATEQSSQTLATLYDNYEFARARAGNMLLSLLIEDIGNAQTQVMVESDYKPSKLVELNKREADGRLTNSILDARLKVALNDVPSTSTFRQQTLQYLTQITQGLPDQYKGAMVKFLVRLTDISPQDKQDIIEMIAKANGEQVEREPRTQEEAMQIQAMRQQAQEAQEMQRRAALAELELKEAQALKLKAEAQKAMDSSASDAEKEQLKQKLEEYEQMLIDAKDEYDAKMVDSNKRHETALAVARINANAAIEVARLNSNDKLKIDALERELSEIERLLGITDTQSSVTDNQDAA